MLEDIILEDIDKNWLKYNNNKQSIIENEIIKEYIDILNFYDSEYPDVKKDEISHYNINKTIILDSLREQLIEEIKKSIFFEKILDAYNAQKKQKNEQ